MASFGNLETSIPFLVDLMREHEDVHELAERAIEAVTEAQASPGDAVAQSAAIEAMRDLDAYLAEDLVIHIGKEEDVLFPALRGLAADLDKVVFEMVEQHDEVRAKSAAVEQAMQALDAAHKEVEDARAGFATAFSDAAGGAPGVPQWEVLLDAAKRLDWILQGHFGDEEDDLFVPAIELLSDTTWGALQERALALETD